MPKASNRARQAMRSRRAGRSSESSSTTASPPTCLFCGEPIGTNEPVVVVEHEGERQTLLAREPELAGQPGALLLHVRCAPAGWSAAG
jgi:hypothetical protein